MIIYTICSLSILLIYLFGRLIQPSKIRSRFYFFCTLLVFSFIMGFRNDFATDYINYVNAYYKYGEICRNEGFFYYLNPANFGTALELGFTYLCIILFIIFGEQYIFLFLVSALIILIPLWLHFKSNPYFLLIVFVYISMGTYFESFNVMRQMMAASICFLSFDYLEKKKFIKYILVVLIASLFHKSSLVMIPMYFVLMPLKGNKLYGVRQSVLIIGGLLAIVLIRPLLTFYINRFEGGYYEYTQGMEMISWKNILLPLIIYIPCVNINMLFSTRENLFMRSDNILQKEEIYSNGSFVWIILEVCCIYVPLATRFASFLSPFFVVYSSNSMVKGNKKIGRFVIPIFVIVLFCLRLYLARNSDLMNNYGLWFNN